jgi:limonene-1,2-epoxide hydrolase
MMSGRDVPQRRRSNAIAALAVAWACAPAFPAVGEEPPARQTKEEREMTTGIGIVEAFVEAFNHKDVDRIMTFFTEDAVYHNMPGEPVAGTAAVRKAIESYVPTASSIDWEIVHAAQIGDTVLTERIDRFVIGGKPVVLPVMGAFDLRQGKIAAWRDYFDMATWGRQMQR